MKLLLDPIGGHVQIGATELERASSGLRSLEAELLHKREVVREGWGAKKVHAKGKLTTWERIESLIDPGSEVLRVGSLVNWGVDFPGSRRQAPGAGVVTAFCRVADRWTMVIANDNTVASGAWWPLTPEKIERAQEMALKLCLPVIYLVDCSGLFLPEQARSFPGRSGAGHIFKKNAELSAAGVPQIAGVFGDCIAGGGYMPIISDRVYMTEKAYMVIAGAALIQGAKSQKLTSLDIGGPEVHVHQSACADVRVPDDARCLEMLRREVSRLPTSAVDFYRHGVETEGPLHPSIELEALIPADHRQGYDIREVLARLVDASLFHEFLPERGKEVITGVARISGLWVGIAGNISEPIAGSDGRLRPGGILYREGIAKLSTFSRACDADGIPLFWLQDVAGFDIGLEAEAQGLLGYGSSLIYSNSTTRAPVFTVLLRKASGAGYYAMHGLPYEPIIQLSSPLARLAVMEGRTLAIAAFNTRLDDNFEIASTDPAEHAEVEEGMARTAARIEADMDPVKAASQMDTDEVIRLCEIRTWMSALSEMAYQSIGHRRIKNPRIWSLHDLEVLCTGQQPAPAETKEVRSAEPEQAPQEGLIAILAPMEGSFWSRPSPKDAPFIRTDELLEPGQTLALIEVMKTFSPIRASEAGHLVSWLVADGEGVSAGQVMGWLRPL